MAFAVTAAAIGGVRAPAFQAQAARIHEQRREAHGLAPARRFFGFEAQPAVAASSAAKFTIEMSGKATLFSVPVSNFAARCRHLVYAKGLEGAEVEIKSPQDVGGLKSEEYMKARPAGPGPRARGSRGAAAQINPLGKMPALVTEEGTCLFESEVINSYLLDKYAAKGEGFKPSNAEARAYSSLVARFHDIYMGPLQACMYKDGIEPEARRKMLQELLGHLDTLEGLMAKAPGFASYGLVGGPNLSAGDVAVYPTFVFYTRILPEHFKVDPFAGRPSLARWWATVKADAVAAKVIAEMEGGLDVWAKNDRWATVLKDYKP
eukprot:tig00000769_g4019.t1